MLSHNGIDYFIFIQIKKISIFSELQLKTVSFAKSWLGWKKNLTIFSCKVYYLWITFEYVIVVFKKHNYVSTCSFVSYFWFGNFYLKFYSNFASRHTLIVISPVMTAFYLLFVSIFDNLYHDQYSLQSTCTKKIQRFFVKYLKPSGSIGTLKIQYNVFI